MRPVAILLLAVACKSDPASQLADSGSAPDATTEDTTGPLARRASDFLDSLGVCTHMGQGIDGAAQVATALTFAGIREIRDDGSPSHVPDWITVHTNSGARLSLLTDQNVGSTLAMAKQLHAAGALLAVEGPNEPNNFAVTYGGSTSSYTGSFAPVAHLQADLYAAIHGDATLAGIPVFHASEAGGSEPDNVGLQYLAIPPGAGATMPDGTTYADFANTHNYVVGNGTGLVDNIAWNAEDPTLNGRWDGMYVEYGHTWHMGFAGYSNAELPTVPRVTTETGWLTTGTNALTQEQQARVFLNLYLAAFARDWSYTFIYMLRDDPNQGAWGLFDQSWAPKTSGTYLHNLTTILADPASTIAPGHLAYTIANPPATVHDLLLQKADRTFELAVWGERVAGTDSITVELGRTYKTVAIYDPTTGTQPVQQLTDVASVTLELGDHPVIVEPKN